VRVWRVAVPRNQRLLRGARRPPAIAERCEWWKLSARRPWLAHSLREASNGSRYSERAAPAAIGFQIWRQNESGAP